MPYVPQRKDGTIDIYIKFRGTFNRFQCTVSIINCKFYSLKVPLWLAYFRESMQFRMDLAKF